MDRKPRFEENRRCSENKKNKYICIYRSNFNCISTHREIKYCVTLLCYRKASPFLYPRSLQRHSERYWKQGREPLNSSSEADASQRYGSLSWELMIHDRLCIRGVRLLHEREPNREEERSRYERGERKTWPTRSFALWIIEGSVNQYTAPKRTERYAGRLAGFRIV